MKQYIRSNPHHSFLYVVGAGLVIMTFVTGFLSWLTSANLYAELNNITTQSAFASSAPALATNAKTTASTASSSSTSPKASTPAQSAPQASKSSATPTKQSGTTSTSSPAPTSVPSGATAAGKQLFVDPARSWQPSAIASQSVATWITSSSNIQGQVNAAVSKAAASGAVATLVAYNIPGRDCGLYSKGGASGSDSYRAWIRSFAAGIGGRSAIVILEPDALASIDCLSPSLQADRYALLSDAVTVLSTTTGAAVYLDGGNSGWQPSSEMANRLNQANIAGASGFSLNVSNFYTTSQSTTYGRLISAKVGGKHFVIDTSRNGNGSAGGDKWCNPTGRALGTNPTTSVGGLVDAYLWVKVPGESDGDCGRNEPAAGKWFASYADSLVANR